MIRRTLIKLLLPLVCTLLFAGCTNGYYGTVEGWDAEDGYWRNNYFNEPYYIPGYGYDAYQPAYMYGVEAFHHYPDRHFEDINEGELRTGWEKGHGRTSGMDWAHARCPVRAAFMHMSQHASNGGGMRRW